MQLRDLEATFAAEEDGGTASVVSKVNLWKIREQAALASGEKTVSALLHDRIYTAPLFFPQVKYFRIYFSKIYLNKVGTFNSQKGLR
jgi:hypothetical protein